MAQPPEEPPEEPPEGPFEEPPEGPFEEPPGGPFEEPPGSPFEEPSEEPPYGLPDDESEEGPWDRLAEPQWVESPEERWGEPEIHSPAELAQRRAAERAARRRVGRQRLLVLLAGVIALVVIIVLVTGSGGGSPTSSNPPPAATKAAGTGSGPGYLAAGSIAAALPTNILIADRNNNRVVVVSPLGRVVWSSPELSPSDAYFSSSGRSIVVTQHLNAVVLLRGVDSGRIDYSYGHANTPGSGDDRLRDPQTGHLTATGQIVIADLGNCRILFVRKPSHIPASHLGTGSCVHAPPTTFAEPDAAVPTSDGGLVVTERNPGWIDVLSKTGTLVSQTRLANFSQPYDANEFAPGKLIVTDRTHPGTVEELSAATGSGTAGKVIWTYSPKSGAGELKDPTLAVVLADGDVLVADSLNDRVIVIDPKTNKIVWQYGHTATPGSAAGYLHTPESVDLLP
jgi:outer membrane protein assembly factor BamB